MSYEYFYRGHTVKIDFSEKELTIEGHKIPKKEYKNISKFPESSDPIGEKNKFAKKVLKRSQIFKKREKIRNAHLKILKGGVTVWNEWRRRNPEIQPLLYHRILSCRKLKQPLDEVNFANAVLINSNFNAQTLKKANFHEANLEGAKLLGTVDLTEANLCRANLYKANLKGAILNKANLQGAQLAKTNFKEAKLNGCKVYGASAWGLKLDKKTEQNDITIRYLEENMEKNGEGKKDSEVNEVKVNNIEAAQLMFLLLNNPKIPKVLNIVHSKTVLILGRFTGKRKIVLDELRKNLRREDYVPIMFDFEKPKNRDLTETVSMLAHLANFVIADITEPNSIPQELQKIIPNLPSLPVHPIILKKKYAWEMFKDFAGYLSVLPPYRYQDKDQLIKSLKKEVIKPALDKVEEIEIMRNKFIKKLKKH